MVESLLPALPAIIPLVTGAFLTLALPRDQDRQFASVTGSILILLTVVWIGIRVSQQGIMVLDVGDWKAPFGIVFAIDWLSVLMLFFLNLIGFCVVIYSIFKRVEGRGISPYFDALLMFQLAGVNGALTTGDLFNLFVWYEVMLISSYALFAQGGGSDKLKGVPDYMVINILSSSLFLVGVGLTYATYGTLNLAHLAQTVRQGIQPPWSSTIAAIFFVVFGTKAAVFPLYFWLFRGYPLVSTPIAALFGGLLTKVGVYSFLRVFPLMFPAQLEGEQTVIRILLYLVGAASILFGVAGALSRDEWKDILSHHITSQIGYMIVGIGLWTPLAVAGTLYYIVQHTVVKSGLFLIGGMTEDFLGSTRLKDQSGLIETLPVVGILFMTAGLALAGLPPLSGFFAKMTIFYAAFQNPHGWGYFVVGVGLVGGLFTLYSMIKIWRYAFMGDPVEAESSPLPAGLYIGPTILVVTSIVLGLAGGLVMNVTLKASNQLFNPDPYIKRVLGDSPVYGIEPGEYRPEPPAGKKGH